MSVMYTVTSTNERYHRSIFSIKEAGTVRLYWLTYTCIKYEPYTLQVHIPKQAEELFS